jgi:hypothetical protein
MVEYTHITLSVVMRGLDPRIQEETPQVAHLRPSLQHSLMDCRVEPGNDTGEVSTRLSEMAGTSPAMTGMGGGQ